MANIQWAGPLEWNEWTEWIATGLHGRNRWRLPILMSGALFAAGLRTVNSWLRAAGITIDYDAHLLYSVLNLSLYMQTLVELWA